jgi:hypothetical protein
MCILTLFGGMIAPTFLSARRRPSSKGRRHDRSQGTFPQIVKKAFGRSIRTTDEYLPSHAAANDIKIAPTPKRGITNLDPGLELHMDHIWSASERYSK